MALSWKAGFSWTKGYWAITINPDGSREVIHVHSGPFLYYPDCLGLYFYIGFRPTPTWSSGFGNEGILGPLARWLKKKGWGNLGVAFRRAE